jgi:abhydrolase domain-containing protein 6
MAAPARLLLAALLVFAGLAGCSAVQGQVIKRYDADIRQQGGLSAPRTEQLAGDDVVVIDRERGEEPVLLLHGFGGEKAHWYLFSQHVPERFRLVAPDLPPFGDSPATAGGDYSVTAQITRLEALRERLGIERWHVVGNSMGGMIATTYAHAHPDRVITLALFAPAGATSAEPSEADQLRAQGTDIQLVRDEDEFDRLFSMATYKPIDIPDAVKGWFLERGIARSKAAQPARQALDADRERVEALLPEVQTPALVLWGKDDRILHVSGADVFDRLLPHSKKIVLLECGHLPMLEYPKSVAEEWVRFVDGAGAQ